MHKGRMGNKTGVWKAVGEWVRLQSSKAALFSHQVEGAQIKGIIRPQSEVERSFSGKNKNKTPKAIQYSCSTWGKMGICFCSCPKSTQFRSVPCPTQKLWCFLEDRAWARQLWQKEVPWRHHQQCLLPVSEVSGRCHGKGITEVQINTCSSKYGISITAH